MTCVVDLHENLVVRARAVKHRLKAMRLGLETFLKAYAQDDPVGETLKLHLADQGMIPTRCAECARREQKDWEALVAAQPPVEGPGFSERDMHHQPEDNPYTPERYVASLLAAVRQAQTQPINPMIATVQTTDRTKYCVFRWAVWKLLEIFERDTGIPPIVSANSYADDGITGNACEYLLKALSPANLIERKVLVSNIVRAYKEWSDKRQ